MSTVAETRLEQYRAMHKKSPPAKWLAVAAKIPLAEAEQILGGQGELFDAITPMPATVQAAPSPVVQKPVPVPTAPTAKLSLIDRATLVLVNKLQHVAFVVVALADFALECLFYSTFAPNAFGKLILATWGFVIVSAKLWAWSSRRTALAVFCASLSVIGSVGIFNASMDAQAVVAQVSNASRIEDPRLAIQRQIKAVEADIEAMTAARAALGNDYPTTARDYGNKIAANYALLPQLRAELEKPTPLAKAAKVEIVLDAWSIFGQVSNKIGVDPKAFAFCFILAVSILIQWIVGATTPKKQ